MQRELTKLSYEFEQLLLKKAQQYSDMRSMPGVKADLFGPQSWLYINKLMGILNTGLTTLSTTAKNGNPIDFRSVSLIPSLGANYGGSLSILVQFAKMLWGYATVNSDKPFTVDQAKAMEKALSEKIASGSFSEPGASTIKANLINILGNWRAVLG